MRLSTRLTLLVGLCLLPVVAAQVYSQYNLHAERTEQLRTEARQQASLANANLAGMFDSVHQLGTTLLRSSALEGAGDDCAGRLNALRQSLPRYRFLAVVRPEDGALVCGSDGADVFFTGARQAWLDEIIATTDLSVGPLQPAAGGNGRFLPVGVHLAGPGTPRPTVLIAGLDLEWLAAQLAAARAPSGGSDTRSVLILADRDGTMLSQPQDGDAWAGRTLPDWLRPVLQRQTAGDETVRDTHGTTFIAAYVPDTTPPRGLTVINLVPLFTADFDRTAWQDAAIVAVAVALALILAWIAGRRFIYRPTETLLRAARRWREGDLAARAELSHAGAEFASLAQSFNAMAAGLAARETERKMQASFLEQQVAERTRELSETNNRLQVEIAGRERTEAALHQAQKLQAVGQLAGGIAHDFNNLLATVLGNLELMERRVQQAHETWGSSETERLLRLIERAVGAVQRGSQLTSRLLAFSRRQRLAARATDINALLQELITLATSTLGRRVQVVAELNDQLWPAMIDPSQVEAAILNLCLNARDAMPDGGRLTIRTGNLRVPTGRPRGASDLAPGEYVQICIEDTGTGMTPEVKARAFEPFFTTKGPGAGSGLGLSQVYGLARQSGGAVHIDSEPGAGTRVTLSLPRAAAEVPSETEDADPPSAPPVDVAARNELILVVDDDHAVRQVTVEMARDLGFEVAQAAGGEQALALLDKLAPPPRMILLDYAMPGMNGLQLARALRDRGITAPIALVTGYAELSEADVQSGELAGLLRKPFTIRELQVLLRQLRASVEPNGRELASEAPAP